LEIPGLYLRNRPNLIVIDDALGGGEGDLIILSNLSEGAKERIAMARNHHVPRSARKCCGGDVPHRLSEDVITVAFQHHHGYTDPGYFHPSDQEAHRDGVNGRD
jgi:hypothetical protein